MGEFVDWKCPRWISLSLAPDHADRAKLAMRGRVVGELWAGDVGLGRGCLFLLPALTERPQTLKALCALCGGFAGVGHFLGSFAMITDSGAHALIPRSLAISAISHAVTPPRLWALAISSARRSLGESVADLSTVGGMSVRVDGSGRPEGSPACGLVMPLSVGRMMRPARVEARRMLAAVIWQGREQYRWTLPLRTVGCGNSMAQCAHVSVAAVAVEDMTVP